MDEAGTDQYAVVDAGPGRGWGQFSESELAKIE
eukprot:CAMPEP_0118968950 /NCGR_PEP_ID=MMETSP1173-20130426/6112_1 /TAXON_ID=1034831 /ORGANISM="Rhizochromulina marina cf, Strain CCMP1243" /LENGTH=32 /DNA_ID= /DNA_START= /DNA_END= /DNA_ORIENTATION=